MQVSIIEESMTANIRGVKVLLNEQQFRIDWFKTDLPELISGGKKHCILLDSNVFEQNFQVMATKNLG